jgi:polysaccharide biosynthesis transport protein
MAYLPPQFNVEVQRTPVVNGVARPLPNRGDWSAAPPEPPSQLLEYWQVMRANLGWICLLAAIGAGAGWLVAAMKPAMYEAKTVLDIRSLNEDFLNPRDGSPVSNSGSVLPESYIQTEIKILSSDSLRKRALGRLDGLKNPPKTSADTSTSLWHTLFGQFEKKPVPLLDLAVDAARRVKVRAVGNTRIVEVLCDAKDAELAANICNNLANTYITYNLESRYNSTRETGDWLQQQLADVKKRLAKSENDLKDASRDGSGALQFDPSSNDNPARDKLRQIEADLSRAETDRINRESDYAIASTRPAESMPMALDAGPIREYRMKLSDLRRQLAEKSATEQPGHPEIRQLKEEITEIEKSLKQERDDRIRRLKADLDTAQRRETVLRNAYEKQATQVLTLGDKTVRTNMLSREVASDQKLYENLLQRVDEVGLAAAMRTSTISVVDPAVAPGGPYSPNVMFSILVGMLGGGVLGLCFSFIHVRSDRTLRGPGEASMHLQLRELGVIPTVRNRRLDLLGKMRTAPDRSLAGVGLQDEPSAESLSLALPRTFPSSLALATWLRVPEITEAIFGTMSSLRFATERGERAGVIVVTSPEPGEGKTTVATNLAIALAQIGRRVIIVDGDLRKPRLDKIFDTVCEGGLASLLEKLDPVEDLVLSDFVRKTAIPNLTVLATKAANEGICTKLHSSRMRILLERLREEYDSVVIDSPPMLQIADARVLGWLADGVLLVLRARKTTRDSAIAAYHCLLQDGINVLGTVLNDWNPGRGEAYGAYKSYIRVN